MIYEPREDSYLFKKWVEKLAIGNVLDLGTGSGIQAEAAKEKGCEVVAVDIDKEAVEFVKKKGINAFVSDLFSNVSGKFDTIIFNPPYLPEDEFEDFESKLTTTGGKKGFEILERFFSGVGKYLKYNGIILIVFSSLTGDVDSIIKKNGFKFKLLEKEHIFFEDIIVYLVERS